MVIVYKQYYAHTFFICISSIIFVFRVYSLCAKCSMMMTATWVKGWSKNNDVHIVYPPQSNRKTLKNFEAYLTVSAYNTALHLNWLHLIAVFSYLSCASHLLCITVILTDILQITLCMNLHPYIFKLILCRFFYGFEWQEERYVDDACLCRYLRSYGVYRVFTSALRTCGTPRI